MKRSITAQFTVALAVVSVVVLAGFAVMIVAARKLQTADQSRSASTTALTSANQLEQSVLDLETGLRGYLLAGRPVFLQPYQAALRQYPVLARTLEASTASDPPARRLTASIAAAIHAYVIGWSQPVIQMAQRDLAAARRAEAGGGGKARVDAMRAQFATLLAHETELHSGEVGQASNLASIVLVAGLIGVVAFALLIVFLAIRVQHRLVAPLKQLATGVAAITGGELSVRVAERGTAEVAELERGFNRMAKSLELQRNELEDHREELEVQRDELEAALASVEERTERIQRLRRFGDQLAAENSIERVSTATLAGMADAGGCDIGAAYLLDSDSDAFVPVAWRGLQRGDLPLNLVPGEGLAGRALAERKMVGVDYAEASLSAEGLGQRCSAAHELHLPIQHGERVIGVISLGRLHDQPFADAELVMVCDLADRAGVDWAQALATTRLRQIAHELGAVLETIDEGVYGIDTAGDITVVNRAALELTGFTREELLGHNSHELLHHSHEDGSPYPQEECPVVRACQTGEGIRTTGEVYWRKDGTSFPVEYSAYPLLQGDEITGAVVTFLDRTARRQAQRQRDTVHALTRIFAEVPSLSEAGPLMLSALCEGLGFDVGLVWTPVEEEDALRVTATYAAPGFEGLLPIIGTERLPRTGTLPGRALDRREPVVCSDLKRDPPREVPIDDPRLRIAIADAIHVGSDLALVAEFYSTRSVAEDGLVDTVRAIGTQIATYIERQHEKEETQRMKDQIVANVSHELRTPLTAIDGWVHILLGGEPGPLTDEQRRFLTIVKRNSDRLMRLVGDLLVAGQVEAGRLKLELGEVDVSELARETAELLAASVQAKRIDLSVRADAPVVVHGDRQRLGQLLSNLVANAIKFTPEEGNVDVSVERQNGSCRIRVSDSGIGIPKGDREHLFERFFRASSATDRGITGTGLGLAISKAIAESHDGTIELADGDGPGAVFVVELPLNTVELPLNMRKEVYT
jgi:PAS domain S-box-containing protein